MVQNLFLFLLIICEKSLYADMILKIGFLICITIIL